MYIQLIIEVSDRRGTWMFDWYYVFAKIYCKEFFLSNYQWVAKFIIIGNIVLNNLSIQIVSLDVTWSSENN